MYCCVMAKGQQAGVYTVIQLQVIIISFISLSGGDSDIVLAHHRACVCRSHDTVRIPCSSHQLYIYMCGSLVNMDDIIYAHDSCIT